MTAIGNQAALDAMLDINQRFKNDPCQEEETATGRILYGYEGDAARLKDSAIKGGKLIRYVDETRWRGSNCISFVVVNADANLVQDQILRLLYKVDNKVIVSNEVIDEYFTEYSVRYATISNGDLFQFCHSEVIPQANYETSSAQRKLTSLQNKIRKIAFKKLQAQFDWVDASMLMPLSKI
jgi:hypothetical protein